MSAVDWDLVAELFADAVELPADRRAAFLADRCKGRPELRSAIERLLDAEAAAGSTFLRQAEGGDALDRLGPFRIIREVGRGGMGQVFLAERADGSFEQYVAIKLLKRGMDSDAILGRFLRERQILASLNHPNIARLIDGGMAGDGRPYLVMEYVDGEPITLFCDARRLSVDRRLHLFRSVCQAVEYAHRNLVVHRDIKPSNVFVTADGQPKLLDFGIAKLITAEGEAEATTMTQLGARVLTPEYAAPEQFAGTGVTTSVDVYALGAVLYELLSGRPAVAAGGDRVQSHEAPRLSASLASVAGVGADAAIEIAAARSTEPSRLRRRLAGDLETIVATALRSEPDRRYASVGALREDVQRHQQRLPVLARPDTAVYRITRFVERHRAGVLATAALATIVLAFGATASWQAVRIRAQAAALELERDRAQTEAAAAEEVSSFLVSVFEVSNPALEGYGDSISARGLLDRGAERIDDELSGQPELQARLLGVIGSAYHNLLLHDRAEPLLARALELRRSVHGDESEPVVAALRQLARSQARRANFAGAESLLRQAISIQERISGNELTAWPIFLDLYTALHGRGDAQAATAALDEAWMRFERHADAGATLSLGESRRMTELLRHRGSDDELDRALAKLVELETAANGPGSAAVARVYSGWASARETRGDFEAADSLRALALDIHRRRDRTSLATADALASLARLKLRTRDYEGAYPLFREAITLLRERLGDEHENVIHLHNGLAEALHRDGRFAEAIPLYRHAHAAFQADSGSTAASILPPLEWRLAVALREAGDTAESLATFQSSLRRFEERFPADYILTASVRHDLGALLVDLGRAAEAEPMLRRALDVFVQRWGDGDVRVDSTRIPLARALATIGRHDEAYRLLTAVRERLEHSRGPDDELARSASEALARLDRPRDGPER